MSSPHKKILVTTATGSQGSGVVRHCLRAGHDVYALTRTPSSPAALALSALGATLVTGDASSPASLAAATRGMDAVFINALPDFQPLPNAETRAVAAAVAAAQASGTVSTVFYTSVAKTGQHDSFPGWGSSPHDDDDPMRNYWLSKHANEELVRAAGFAHWTILRPTVFLQDLEMPKSGWMFPGLEETGVLKAAFGPGAVLDLCDAADVGGFVAAALAEPGRFDGREIAVAAERVTPVELVERVNRVRSRKIVFENYTEEEMEVVGKTPVVRAQCWLNEVGYDVDVEALKEYGVKLTTIEEYFSKAEN
ncbi:putative nad dependent epimerase dehydratase [Diplodia seriata]|uniref:Putative nad dependent epimerase dehydratase n=1 Tax=Diplodia seriata TaxID=420778 RepID=A0A0G2GV97_9PEZI|nr:putative nad dependent epimerase dehydratase [Diplodia seriata]